MGIKTIKWVFALEYVMQGLVNPFQGVTYQPFYRHLRTDYGLSEAATQGLFAKSYLAWSFKPVIGFLIDAYGRTRTVLLLMLAAGAVGFIVTPLLDASWLAFAVAMFAVSVAFAATDVAVDRATVLTGDEEAQRTGASKSTTVGLNQAICWAAVYGSSIGAAVLGGYVAEAMPFSVLMVCLAAVPAVVFAVVWQLPHDTAARIPVRQSVLSFWHGLNTGPILGVVLFYFVFHFQPAMGALWNNHQLETLHFSQTQVGVADGASNAGYFLGVLLFAWKGVKWQERVGLRLLFRCYIAASMLINLTQYLMLEPWFSAAARALQTALPFGEADSVRLAYLCSYNLLLAIGLSLINMSTLSLVGAVVPVAAAGSLFAGFMSVANLAYSFSYSSGAWLYEHGMSLGPVRMLQQQLFGIAGQATDPLSLNMLVLGGSLAYVFSLLCVRWLPDRVATLAGADTQASPPGPERWLALDPSIRNLVNTGAWMLGFGLAAWCVLYWTLDAISTLLLCFFAVTMLRKAGLDFILRRASS